MKGTKINMNQTNIIKTMALFAIVCASNYVQAGPVEAIAAPSTSLLTDSSGSPLNGAYITIGSFGDRSASQVAALFQSAGTATAVGTLLQQNYTSLITPAFFTSSNQFLISSSEGYDLSYEPANLGLLNNTPMYAVIAKQLGADLFQLGVFSANSFTRTGTSSSYVYAPGSQISFSNVNNELGVDSFYFKMKGSNTYAGALAVDTLGSSTLPVTGPAVFSLSTITSTSVPEPSSSALMLFGVTALVALRRLRKNV
jgi:hypothetical protein